MGMLTKAIATLIGSWGLLTHAWLSNIKKNNKKLKINQGGGYNESMNPNNGKAKAEVAPGFEVEAPHDSASV